MEIEESKKNRFMPKPLAISISYRMHTKLALIILILRLNCKDLKASALKIHFFIWALKNHENTERVRELVASNFKSNLEFWTLEPAASRALNYSIAEGLLVIDNGSFILTVRGEKYFQLIQKDVDIFPNEKAFLTAIGKRISDNRLTKIATWAQQNVEN